MSPDQFRKSLLNPWKLKLFLITRLPMAALAGLKVTSFSAQKASVKLRYSYLNKNPFRSIYFAVLAMAAELSTGCLAYYHSQFKERKVSMLVTKMQAEYFKKARSKVSFTCEISELFENERFMSDKVLNEGQTYTLISEGHDETGELVARFSFEWSFRYK